MRVIMRAQLEWSLNNPVLESGETGVEAIRLENDGSLVFETEPETGKAIAKFKSGDGRTAWNALPYADRLLLISDREEYAETAGRAALLAEEARGEAESAARAAANAMESAKIGQESGGQAQRAAEEAQNRIAEISGEARDHAADLSAHGLDSRTRRRLLTAAATIYVRPDGNDANDGLDNTPARALKSAGGVTVWLRDADLKGQPVNVLFTGGYNYGNLDLQPVEAPAYSSNITITSNGAGLAQFDNVFPGRHTRVTLRNIQILQGLHVYGAAVSLADMTFGATGVISPARLINADMGSVVSLLPGTLKFLGGSFSAFNITNGSQVAAYFRAGDTPTIFNVDGYTVTSEFFLIHTGAVVSLPSGYVSFAGRFTGRAYLVSRLALLLTGLAGPDFIPGSIAGVADAASGGFYR